MRSTVRAVAAAALLLALGVAGYVVVRRTITVDDSGAIAMGESSAVTARSLAVLPFVNAGAALGRLPGLRLAGRTSSYAFRAKDVTAPEIGRALGVATLVSGAVRRAGDRVRVTAQLVSASDGAVLWDSIFESCTSDVFALQDELVRSIVAALLPALRGEVDAVERAERGTADPLAHELYLKGRYYFLLRGADNAYRAIDHFRQATQRDPSFARAHAGLMMRSGLRRPATAAADPHLAGRSAPLSAGRRLSGLQSAP